MLIGDYFHKVNSKYKSHSFSNLSFNSASCKKGSIFFAIKGNKIDGNKFIDKAILNGAKTIISNKGFKGFKKKILYLNSRNVRKTLSEISYRILKLRPKNLIAVTGTNGKSSVADFYFQILKFNNKRVASIGTLGIQTINTKTKVSNTTLNPIELGLCLENLKKKKIDNVILEASSHGLDQHRLDGLIFKTGIFTNLSRDHLDYHKTYNNYLKSKLYLFEKLLKKNSNVITDYKIKEFKKIKSIALKKKLNMETINSYKNGLKIISHKYSQGKQLIEFCYKNKIYEFQTYLIGKIQIKNILMAALAAKKSGLSFKQILSAIARIKPVNGRLEKIGMIKNQSSVILDYAHTPDALKTCLKNLKEQFKGSKISIVFGCGGNRDKPKRAMMGAIANNYCDRVYLTDDNPRWEDPHKIRQAIKKKIKKSKVYEIANRAKAIKKAVLEMKTGEILIVAGKGHENIQDYGKYKKFFSDKKEILSSIKIKNKFLSNNLKLNILKELEEANHISSKIKILNASINSKEVKRNDVFFAIKGKNKDGNLFVKEAFNNGASLAVVSSLKKDAKKIKTKDTLKFLTKASSLFRENIPCKIIGITGSCGKTSLKELIGKTLNKISKATYSPKSFNNKFGVPLSLFNLSQKDNYGVLEIGMDKKGEIDNLSKIIKPDVAVITNISYAHIKNFKNIKQIALAKSEIIKNIKEGGNLILNADDAFHDLHKKIASRNNIKVCSFSLKNKNSQIYLESIKKHKTKYKVCVNVLDFKKYFYLNSNFENDIKNLLAAISVISIFENISDLDINIFYNNKTPSGRGDISKVKILNKSFYLIDESYNSNPLSLNSALKNFQKIEIKNKKKHLLLGDMLELGSHSKKLHEEICKKINQTSIQNVNVIGKHMSNIFKNLNKKKRGLILKDKFEIINLIKNNINNNDYLMIKGSNSTGLNIIANNLKKGNINAL